MLILVWNLHLRDQRAIPDPGRQFLQMYYIARKRSVDHQDRTSMTNLCISLEPRARLEKAMSVSGLCLAIANLRPTSPTPRIRLNAPQYGFLLLFM